jgi:hypothetical protein
MADEVAFTITSDNDDLAEFLDVADEYKEQHPEAVDKLEAKTKNTGFMSAGVPEITEIILALGSSGALLAVQGILKAYFAKRPKAELTFHKKGKSTSTRILLRNADAASLKALFDNLDAT